MLTLPPPPTAAVGAIAKMEMKNEKSRQASTD